MSKILALSEAVGIALHSMGILAIENKALNANVITERTGSSKHHIAKILQRLVKSGLLTSTRGPSGGFVLVKPPKETSLLDIYEAIEGKVHIHECPMNSKQCPFDNNCMLDNVGEKIARDFMFYMENTSLEDIKNNSKNH
jgi:Rrf2 family protein